MIELSVKLLGYDSWQHAMLDASQWNRRPFYTDKGLQAKMHKIFLRQTDKVWETQGSVLGKRWPALSDTYAAWKRKHYPGRALMHRSLRLIRSFIEPNRRDAISEVDSRKTMATFGTRVPYSAYHQQPGPRSRLPERALFKFTPKFAREYDEAFRDSLHDFLKPRFNGGL